VEEEQNSKGAVGEDEKSYSSYQSIKRAAHLLEEVNDIRYELNILRSLLIQQNTVWRGLFEKSDNEDLLWSPVSALDEIEAIDKVAKRIQDSVSGYATLKQILVC
jgi:hypothetical protein